MSSHAQDIPKEVRRYILVFAALAFLTIVTVAIKSLHLNLMGAITVAIFIAVIKGSLVACYFMHLISERKLVYGILILTVFFLAALAVLLISGYQNTQTGLQYVS